MTADATQPAAARAAIDPATVVALERLLRPAVAVPRAFFRITGNVGSALLLAQARYRSGLREFLTADGWVIFSRDAIHEEVGLSRFEAETARRRLRELGLIQERRRGVPPHLEVRVDEQRLGELLAPLAAAELRAHGRPEALEPAKTEPRRSRAKAGSASKPIAERTVRTVFERFLTARRRYYERKRREREIAPEPTLTPARVRLIRAAVAAHGERMAKAAVSGIFFSPFHQGENERGQELLRIELALRMRPDRDAVEEFALLFERELERRGYDPGSVLGEPAQVAGAQEALALDDPPLPHAGEMGAA